MPLRRRTHVILTLYIRSLIMKICSDLSKAIVNFSKRHIKTIQYSPRFLFTFKRNKLCWKPYFLLRKNKSSKMVLKTLALFYQTNVCQKTARHDHARIGMYQFGRECTPRSNLTTSLTSCTQVWVRICAATQQSLKKKSEIND